jgi:hypothetical protein
MKGWWLLGWKVLKCDAEQSIILSAAMTGWNTAEIRRKTDFTFCKAFGIHKI